MAERPDHHPDPQPRRSGDGAGRRRAGGPRPPRDQPRAASATRRAAPTPPASARTPSPACGSSPARARSRSTAATQQVYFARPVLRMMIQPAASWSPTAPASSTSSCTVTGGGLSGQAGAVRHGISKALTLLRAGAAPGPQEGRLPHPRQPRRGAQEVRPRQGTPQLPVLEALIAAHRPRLGACIQQGASGSGAPFCFGIAVCSTRIRPWTRRRSPGRSSSTAKPARRASASAQRLDGAAGDDARRRIAAERPQGSGRPARHHGARSIWSCCACPTTRRRKPSRWPPRWATTRPKVLDASTAHRVAPGLGLSASPNWTPARRTRSPRRARVSNPGCYPTGAHRAAAAAGRCRPACRPTIRSRSTPSAAIPAAASR